MYGMAGPLPGLAFKLFRFMDLVPDHRDRSWALLLLSLSDMQWGEEFSVL